jgi:hypothetical protein
MHVIGHEAPCPDADPGGARMLRQQRQIDAVVALAEEDRLPAIASLGYVMRNSRDDDASETGHGRRYVTLRLASNRYSVPEFPRIDIVSPSFLNRPFYCLDTSIFEHDIVPITQTTSDFVCFYKPIYSSEPHKLQ